MLQLWGNLKKNLYQETDPTGNQTRNRCVKDSDFISTPLGKWLFESLIISFNYHDVQILYFNIL